MIGPNSCPFLAGESHHLDLFDRKEIRRRGLDADSRDIGVDLEMWRELFAVRRSNDTRAYDGLPGLLRWDDVEKRCGGL
jgi:hypothetical protein